MSDLTKAECWNLLNKKDRIQIFRIVRPNGSKELIELEAGKDWDDLLPSTQAELEKGNWLHRLE